MLPDISNVESVSLNILRPTERHFEMDFLEWKFTPRVPITNIPASVQIMAWRRAGDKPLSEPMMDNLQTHICVIRSQWVKSVGPVTRICFSETVTFGTNSCEICISIKVVSVINMLSNCRVRHIDLFIICVNICCQFGVFSPLLYVHIHCHIHIWRDHGSPLVILLISVRPRKARNNYIILYALWRPRLRDVRQAVTKRVKG